MLALLVPLLTGAGLDASVASGLVLVCYVGVFAYQMYRRGVA